MSLRVAFVVAVLTIVTVVSAGLTLSPAKAHIGMLTTLTFTLDQMCAPSTDGLTTLTIKMPSSVVKVHVQSVVGWEEQISSSNVTFHGVLPTGHFQEFKLRVALSGAAGDIAYFHAYQDCFGHGPNMSWHAMPTDIDPIPTDAAPSVQLTEASDSETMAEEEPTASEGPAVTVTVTPVPSSTGAATASYTPKASYSMGPTHTPTPSYTAATPNASMTATATATATATMTPVMTDSAILASATPAVTVSAEPVNSDSAMLTSPMPMPMNSDSEILPSPTPVMSDSAILGSASPVVRNSGMGGTGRMGGRRGTVGGGRLVVRREDVDARA